MLGRLYCRSCSVTQLQLCQTMTAGGGTIRAVRITIYLLAFAAVTGIAVAVAWLSIVVAPIEPKQHGLTLLAIALGGLGVAGGIVYLAEKLINLAKGVAFMLAEIIVEKFKKREREIGEQIGRGNERQAWLAWYERQQAALRDGRPFDEPPPGYSADGTEIGKDNQ